MLTAARSKGKCNKALLASPSLLLELISLLMFIDAIPWQGGLISSAGGVLLDEGGPQHEEHSG
jgi:hypothetical protein